MKGAPRMSPPPELVYALQVNVDNLRPWEWGAMEAAQYDEIMACREAWAKAVKADAPS